MPEALQDRPELVPQLEPVMAGYWQLRRARVVTMAGPQPLPFVEIEALLRLMRVGRADRADWAVLWRAMDDCERSYLAEVRASHADADPSHRRPADEARGG